MPVHLIHRCFRRSNSALSLTLILSDSGCLSIFPKQQENVSAKGFAILLISFAQQLLCKKLFDLLVLFRLCINQAIVDLVVLQEGLHEAGLQGHIV